MVSYYFSSNTNVFYPAAFGSIVIIAAYNLPFLNNFGKYGDFTYGLYIFHFPIIQLFKQYNFFEKYNPYLMSLVIIVLTLLLAIFSWFLIEKKFLDRYKKIQKHAD
jgi:peptidoglycan/LPS O-acetylase OafA/YrhL